MKHLTTLALVLAVAFGFTHTARAESHFTIDNQSESRLKVRVYRGNDGWCTVAEKEKAVSKWDSSSISCTGGGQQRCQIIVRDKTNDTRLCKNLYFGSCKDTTITMPHGSTLKIDQQGYKRHCTLIGKDGKTIMEDDDF